MADNVRFIDSLKVGQYKGNPGPQGPAGPSGSAFPFTGSARITGSFDVRGDITSSGNFQISSSKALRGVNPVDNTSIPLVSNFAPLEVRLGDFNLDVVNIRAEDSVTIQTSGSGNKNNKIFFGTFSEPFNAITINTLAGNITASGAITASNINASNIDADLFGNISTSGSISANFGSISGESINTKFLSSSGDIIGKNITASNNISASGFIQSNQITGSTLAIGQDYNSLPNDPGYTGIISRFDGGVFFNIKQEALKTFGINNEAVGEEILQIDTDPNHFLLDPTGNVELKVGLGVVSPSASLDIVGNIQASSHITASGNISSSGNFVGVSGSFDYIKTGRLQIGSATNSTDKVTIDGGDLHLENQRSITFANIGDGNEGRVRIKGDEDNDFIDLAVDNNINRNIRLTNTGVSIFTTVPAVSGLTVAGQISSSGAINTLSHITASGNISSSGTGSFGSLLVDGSSIDFSNVPVSDPGVAGRLFRDGTDLKISIG